MVGPGKGSLTMRALEGLDASVLPHVPSQLVRPGKLPAAALPVALVGLLPRVGPLVRLEVGALRVHFAAARVAAAVNSLVALWLGVVVDGIDQLILAVLRPHARQQVGEVLHGRGGAWTGRGRAGSGEGEVVKGCGGEDGLGVGRTSGMVAVGLCLDVDVHHTSTSRQRW